MVIAKVTPIPNDQLALAEQWQAEPYCDICSICTPDVSVEGEQLASIKLPFKAHTFTIYTNVHYSLLLCSGCFNDMQLQEAHTNGTPNSLSPIESD